MDLTAVTTRDDFLLELGEALGGQASVNPVESVQPALQRLGTLKALQIVAIDARDVADLRADVETVLARAPHAAVLVFAPEGAEQETAALLKGSSVFAVLSLPVDPRKTAAVFDGAVADCKSKGTGQTQKAASPRSPSLALELEQMQPSATAAAQLGADDDGAGKSKLPIYAGAAALAVLAVTGIWYFTKSESPSATRSAVSQPSEQAQAVVENVLPSVETSLVKGKVDELLEKARLAMRERRYSEPAGDNALLFYRSAMAAEPGNGEALDGLTRVAGVLSSRFDEALAENHYDEAATTLAQLRNALPTDPRLAEYQVRLYTAQISKALADDNAERAAALVRAAQQSNAIPAAQLAKWKSDVARLQEEAREKRAAEQAARDAAAAEQKKAREARAAAAAAEAEQQAQAARDQQARQEKLKEEQAARAAQEAAGVKSASATPSEGRSLQSRLKRKRYVPPEYPQEAMARRIGGVVTVAFTVDVNGETRDVRVESADPPKVFDRAAIAAVKRWRYEPLLIDGVATQVPARMAIRFAPQE